MTQAECESTKLRREASTDSGERCTAIWPGSQTIESKSRCGRPSRAAKACAYVLFPEPELPKTKIFMRHNHQAQPGACHSEVEARPSAGAPCWAWLLQEFILRQPGVR